MDVIMSKRFRSLQSLVTKKYQMVSIQNEIQMMPCIQVYCPHVSAQTFFLYRAPQTSFGHQILQAPKHLVIITSIKFQI